MKHFFEESSPLSEYICIWVRINDLTEQLLQENVPLRHLLNEEVVCLRLDGDLPTMTKMIWPAVMHR